MAGASVKATNVATAVLSVPTTSGGEFAFQDLPLGTYKVEVTAAGFRAAAIDNFGDRRRSLYPPREAFAGGGYDGRGSFRSSLTLDTTTATQDNIIPREAVADVPMNGRDFTQFAAVQPGYGGYSVGGFGSLNGTRANQMNWQIDGVDNNDFWHNIPAVNQGGVSGIAGVIMPLDAIDEFAAQTQSNAEGGRNAGGIVNVVLKSGTQRASTARPITSTATKLTELHLRSSTQPAASEGCPTEACAAQSRTTVSQLGGPIIKDKTFWFITFEKQKYTIGLSGLDHGAVAGLSERRRWPCCLPPAVPESSDFGATDREPLAQPINQQSAGDQPDNFFATNPSTGYSYNGVIKLDHNFTEKHHFSVRWFGGQGSQTAPLGGSAALATASSNLSYYFEKAPIHVYNYAATLNSVLTPRMTNQILFGVNYFNQTFNDANHSFDTHVLRPVPEPGCADQWTADPGRPKYRRSPAFEQVGITPPEGRNDITGMLADIVSYNVGKHQFRFGGEFRQGHVDEFYFRHSLGKFHV